MPTMDDHERELFDTTRSVPTGSLYDYYQWVSGGKLRVTGEVVGTDFCAEMLAPAPAKARRAGLEVRFEVADALALPFADAAFDVASIGFGIRNVADPRKGIAEMARVAKTVAVLEFGQPQNRIMHSLYDFYRIHFLPVLGGAVTGNRHAYEYLESSAGKFPCGAEFAELMRSSAPFSKIDFEALSFGIAWLYVGVTV